MTNPKNNVNISLASREYSYEAVFGDRYKPSTSKENEHKEVMVVSVITCDKAGFAREIQGTESLWLNSQLSAEVDPSRDGALGIIGESGKASLNVPIL